MPLPWEATLPFSTWDTTKQLNDGTLISWCSVVLVTGMFAAAGTLLNVSQRAQNLGKVGFYHRHLNEGVEVFPRLFVSHKHHRTK